MPDKEGLAEQRFAYLIPLVLIQAILYTALALFVRDNGWDDGAITLAYAKTFALDGKIALTPISETVEGFSSLSWFLLNSVFMWFHPSFNTMILISQLLTIASLCATTFVLDRLCQAFDLSRLIRFAVLLTFVLWGGAFSEAINGMEMGLFALSASLITLGFLRQYPLTSPFMIASIAIFISTRFESAFYIVFLALPLVSDARKRDFIVTGVISAAAFLLIAVFRYVAFSDFLPNTLWAKMQAPYTKSGLDAARSRFAGFIELPSLFAVPLIALIFGGNLSAVRKAIGPSYKRLGYLFFPIVGAVLFSLAIGSNVGGGYIGRMVFFCVPHALVLMGFIIDRVTANATSSRRLQVAGVMFAVTILTSINIAFPFRYVAAAAAGGSFQVTPKSYADTGKIIDLARQKGGLPTITFMSPDIGGLGLCCEKIRVIDLGLLTNRTLARKGYKALPDLLKAERPQLIEAHWQWASVPRLYDIPFFQEHYRPAYFGETRLFVDDAFADALIAKNEACVVPLTDEAALRRFILSHRYKDNESTLDIFALVKAKSVVVLKALDKQKLCETSSSLDGAAARL